MVERTLSFIKPDGVKKALIGEVIRRYESSGLRVVAMKMLRMSVDEAERFYEVHRDKPFFKSLTHFIASGPVVVMVLEGEDAISKNRELMGATDPRKAERGTIRGDFATEIERNIVHGSDSPESAQREIRFFFSDMEIFSY